METKICIKCGIEKNINEFYFRKDWNKYINICKECNNKKRKENFLNCNEQKEKNRIRAQLYYENNKEEVLNKAKLRYTFNSEEKIEKQKKYYKKNIEKVKEYKKEYRINNEEKIKQHKKEFYNKNQKEIIKKQIEYRNCRKKEDKIFYFTERIRNTIRTSFIKKGMVKSKRSEEIIGMPLNELYYYLLQTFKDNYGYEWDGIEDVHIDHIIPISTAKSEKDVIKLCHYSNLQLLKAKDNLEKRDRLDWTIKQGEIE